LTSLPWPTAVQTEEEKEQAAAMLDPKFLKEARAQLDSDHFGLEKIKKRLVEYLAIVRLKYMNAVRASKSQEMIKAGTESSSPSATPRNLNRAPILLFVGPPGVGKTSLGQSVAKALHRPYQRISLGGVRDEAEIRGHRRTYVASGPGSIVQALRKAGRRDPVLLLDEIDKVGGSNFQGDPSAALLEVLDPEQNWSFRDHYINVPIDLSGVLFICTANSIEGISGPLLDRCEVIQLSGYTYDEKMSIAKRFLLPKQIKINGMNNEAVEEMGKVQLTDETLECIATKYTKEAGVRSLERVIGAVVRSKAVEWADWIDKGSAVNNALIPPSYEDIISGNRGVTGNREWKSIVQKEDLEAILGPPRWDGEEKEREERRGVVWGLVVMGLGEGAIMPVESIAVPGSGRLKLTGSLGDVSLCLSISISIGVGDW
jgi:ATP-dependent Lon protease